MEFKEMVQRDIENVFLTPEEFGEPHVINQKEMNVIIDNNELLEREKKTKMMDEGLYRKQFLIYVSAGEFGKLPAIGRILEMDGSFYRVTDAIDEAGIYSINMEVNKS